MDAHRLRSRSTLAISSILLASILALVAVATSAPIERPLEVDGDPATTSARSCAGPANVDRIRVLPPGPVLLAADDVLELNATMFDASDVELTGPPTWGADGGTLQVMDSHLARYSPSSTGQHVVWACAGSVNTSVTVNVVIGEVTDLRLSVSSENVTADDVVVLDLVRLDARGNEQEAFVLDTTNWTVPEGSSLSLPIGTSAQWTPGATGSQTISVADGGFLATITLNVSHGVATSLTIDGWAVGTPIDADSVADLTMSLRDQRGNGWTVNGTWDVLGTDGDQQLASDGANATFDASITGAWTIEGSYEDPDSGGHRFVGTLEIVVVPGRLAWLELAGGGSTVRIGEPLTLLPSGRDADGNGVSLDDLEWSVSGPSGEDSLDATNLSFSPTSAGQHVVIVESGARIAQITIEVVHGVPASIALTTEDGTGLSVVTGESIAFSVIGTDEHGNDYPVDVEWSVPDGFGNVSPDAGGVGAYLFAAEGTGYVNLVASIGNETWSEVFHVLPGPPASIAIELVGEAVQRQKVEARLQVVDEAGNPAVFGACSVAVTSSAGPASCSAGTWTIELLNSGEQQRVEARLDEAYGVAYLDVEPVLLGGVLGSDQTVLLLGGVLIALLICGVLLAGYWKSGVMLRDRRRASKPESSGGDGESAGDDLPTLMPAVGAPETSTAAPTSIPAMLANRTPIPPPASVFATGNPPPLPPGIHAPRSLTPPHVPNAPGVATSRATSPSPSWAPHGPAAAASPTVATAGGLASAADPLHASSGVWSAAPPPAPLALTPLGAAFDALGGPAAVEDDAVEDPEPTTAGVVVEEAEADGGAAAPPETVEVTEPEAEGAEEGGVASPEVPMEASTPQSSAAEPESSAAKEAEGRATDGPVPTESGDAVSDRSDGAERNEEIAVTAQAPDGGESERAPTHHHAEGAPASARGHEEDGPSTASDEEGEGTSPIHPEEDAGPALAPEEGDPWTLDWYSPGAVLPRERGPRMGVEPLRPLPGTDPGDDGWYFDDDGRPSHWEHVDGEGWRRTDAESPS